MRWFLWALMGWYGVATVITASQVGKPRRPLTATAFAVSLLLSIAVVVGCVVALDRGVAPS